MRSVRVGEKPWTGFDAREETVSFPAGLAGRLEIEISYR
jgi:hypothetical protein